MIGHSRSYPQQGLYFGSRWTRANELDGLY
jgi:hypothetical protein